MPDVALSPQLGEARLLGLIPQGRPPGDLDTVVDVRRDALLVDDPARGSADLHPADLAATDEPEHLVARHPEARGDGIRVHVSARR